jgi:DNA-binding transcriptional regulator YiaG
MPKQYFTISEIESETWRPVPEFEHLYSVSSLGRIQRTAGGKGVRAGRILKVRPKKSGHLRVVLCKNGVVTEKSIHQLVALAFIGPRPQGKEVNHVDRVPDNNRSTNLEYLTPIENVRHSIDNIRAARFKRTHCVHAKLSPDNIRQVRQMFNDGVKTKTIARIFNVHYNTVRAIFNGKAWQNIN